MDPNDLQQLRQSARKADQAHHYLFGNGDVGAAETLRQIQAELEQLMQTVREIAARQDAIERQRDALANQMRGARTVLMLLGAIILAGGGGLSVYLVRALSRILGALP